MPKAPKPAIFLGSSLRDLQAMPGAVRRAFGRGILDAQYGDMPEHAKVLAGFGDAGVLELIERAPGSTFRAVYAVRFEDVVYILHAFQKKSKSGIATTKQDLDLVRARLAVAEADHAQRGARMPSEKIEITVGSGNIFADLGLPEPDLELAKAEVARAIRQTIKARGITHQEAAGIMGESRPNVTAIVGGRVARFTLDRLLRSTAALGVGIQITLTPAAEESEATRRRA